MPGIDWSERARTTDLRPREAERSISKCAAPPTQLGSDTSFVQALARGKWIWSLRERRAVPRAQSSSARTARARSTELPASVRFFAGGDNSVRGYDFEALGPVDEDGEVIGGSSLVTGASSTSIPCARAGRSPLRRIAGNAFEGGSRRAQERRFRRSMALAARPDPRRSCTPVRRSERRRVSRAYQPGPGPMRWLAAQPARGRGALRAGAHRPSSPCSGCSAANRATAWIVGRVTERTNGAITIGQNQGHAARRPRARRRAIRLARDEIDIPTLALSWDGGRGAVGGHRALRRARRGRRRIGACRRGVRAPRPRRARPARRDQDP